MSVSVCMFLIWVDLSGHNNLNIYVEITFVTVNWLSKQNFANICGLGFDVKLSSHMLYWDANKHTKETSFLDLQYKMF